MKNKILLLVFIATLLGCKDKVAEFLFDNSKVSEMTDFTYEYESGRMKTKNERTYMLYSSQIVDSMLLKTTIEYDDKGRIIKETESNYFESNPRVTLYRYNSNDSLTLKLEISSNGDTSFIEKYDYFPDGRKCIYHRQLFMHIDPKLDFTKAMENITYDTIISSNEYEYVGNQCKIIKQFNKDKLLDKLVEKEYVNDKLSVETYYTFINSMKLLEKKKYFEYSKSQSKPDSYSLDDKNDTIEYCRNTFRRNDLILSKESFDYGNFIAHSYYKSGKLIGTIDYEKQSKQKIFYEYIYNENGDLKSYKSYKEISLNAR